MSALWSNELDLDELDFVVGELSTRDLTSVGESALAKLRNQYETVREASGEWEDTPTLARYEAPRERVVER
jgi:hypothetical protein